MATDTAPAKLAPKTDPTQGHELLCIVYPDSVQTRKSARTQNEYTVIVCAIRLKGSRVDHEVQLFPPRGVNQVQPGVYSLSFGKSFQFRNNQLSLNTLAIKSRVCTLEELGIDPDEFTAF